MGKMTIIKCPHEKRGRCGCPTAYSRCLGHVLSDAARGDFSKGHGGWGWPSNDSIAMTPGLTMDEEAERDRDADAEYYAMIEEED